MHAPAHTLACAHISKEAVQRGEGKGWGRQTEEEAEGELLRREQGRNDLDETLLFAGRVTPGLCPPMDWHRHSVRMTEGQRPETGMGGFLSRAKARIKFCFREKGDMSRPSAAPALDTLSKPQTAYRVLPSS